MFKHKIVTIFIIVLVIQIFYSCNAVNTAEKKVNKEWDKSDSEIVVDSLVSKLLNGELLKNFSSKRKPKIVVGKIKNRTNEKINTELIEKNIERSFLNSGAVTFISSKSKREEVRYNRKHSEDFANKKEFKKFIRRLKTDFFVDGKLELKIDSLNNSVSKNYILSVQVIDSKNIKTVVSENISVIK